MPQIKVLENFICPLSGELMTSPVMLSNGQVYERKAIELWLQDHLTDPITKEPLSDKTLTPQDTLKKEIETFLETHTVCSKELFIEKVLSGGIEELQNLSYLDSYLSMHITEKENSTLLHIMAEQGHLPMVQWLVLEGSEVNARNLKGEMPLDKAQGEVTEFLILNGASHTSLSYEKLEKLLDGKKKAILTISDSQEFHHLINILKKNKSLTSLNVQMPFLSIEKKNLFCTLFEKNKTLLHCSLSNGNQSFSEDFQLSLERNKELSLLRQYEKELAQVGISLETLFSDDQLRKYPISEIISAQIETLIFKLTSEPILSNEKKACYQWVIYVLSQAKPCDSYKNLLNKAYKGLVLDSIEVSQNENGLDLLNHPHVWVCSEKTFKKLYAKIQAKFPDHIEFLDVNKPVTSKIYQRSMLSIIRLIEHPDVDNSELKIHLGETRHELLRLHFVPLYLKNKGRNAKNVFSKKLNYHRALIEAKEENLLCPISQNPMEEPVQLLSSGIVYEKEEIDAWLKHHNTDYVTGELIVHQSKKIDYEKVQRTKVWLEKYQFISKKDFFNLLQENNLEILQKLNFPKYYLKSTQDGMLPVSICARSGFLDGLKWLVENGVSLEFSDELLNLNQRKPLEWAIHQGYIEITEWIEESIHFNFSSSKAQQLLYLSVGNNQLPMSKWLIKKGIDINLQNEELNTSLHIAVKNNNWDLVVFLIENGANINIRNQKNETPSDIAAQKKHVKIRNFLILQGGDHRLLTLEEMKQIFCREVSSAKIKLSEKELGDFALILTENQSLTRLEVYFDRLSDINRAIFLSVLEKNNTLLHLDVYIGGKQSVELFQAPIKQNQKTRPIRCILPYDNYLKEIGISCEQLFSPENLSKQTVPQIIANLVHWIVVAPFEKGLYLDFKKACYEWVIYLLIDEPHSEEYSDLLKLSFLALLEINSEGGKLGYSWRQCEYLLSQKDLWVWQEEDFKTAYINLKLKSPKLLIQRVVLEESVSHETYKKCVNELLILLKTEPKTLISYIGNMRYELLSLGFIPLYPTAKETCTQVVFCKEMNRYRIELDAKEKGFLCSLSGEWMDDPVEFNGKHYERKIIEEWLKKENTDPQSGNWVELTQSISLKSNEKLKIEIDSFRRKYALCTKDQLLEALKQNNFSILKDLNYLNCYLFSLGQNEENLNNLLNLAIANADFNLATQLLAQEYPLRIEAKLGKELISYAVKHNCLSSINWLITHGCKVNIKGLDGQELLKLAMQHGSLVILNWLVQEGCEFKSYMHEELFYLAFHEGQTASIDWLIQQGYKIKIRQINQNKNLLKSSISKGHLKLVAWLVKLGCKYDGEDLLELVIKEGQIELLSWLANKSSVKSIPDIKFFDLALKYGQLEILNWLVQQDYKLNIKGTYGLNKLKQAVTSNSIDIFMWLIKQGFTANSKALKELLKHAIFCGNLKIIAWLIKQWKSFDPHKDSEEVLLWAIQSGSLSMLECLIDNGYILKFKKENHSRLLYLAIQSRQIQMVQWLVQKGHDINLKDKNKGVSPLFYALEEGCLDIAEFLIQSGCDLNAQKESEHYSPFLSDYYSGKEKKITGKTSQAPLHFAIEAGYIEIAELLVHQGCDLEIQDSEGNTPLHIALVKNNIELAHILIKQKCNFNIQNNKGFSLLHVAVQKGFFDLIRLMVISDCELNLQDKYGRTPLHIALEKINHIDKKDKEKNLIYQEVPYLIQAGCDLDIRDKDEQTVLHVAVNLRSFDLVRLFVEQGCELDGKNLQEQTPLHIAIYRNCLDIAKYLIEQGYYLDAKGEEGKILLSFALKNDQLPAFKWLLELGCSFGLKEVKKDQALFYLALEHGSLAIIKWLSQEGYHFDIKKAEQDRLLHRTVSAKSFNWLLEQGYPFDVRSKESTELLKQAFKLKNSSLAIAIIQQDPNKEVWDAQKLYSWAIEYNCDEIFYSLESRKYKLDTKGLIGQPLLLLAINNGHLASVRYLIKHGCDYSIVKGIPGQALLFLAVKNKHFSIAKWIHEQGKHISKINSDGLFAQSLLRMALENDDVDIFYWLKTTFECDEKWNNTLSIEDYAKKHGSIKLLKNFYRYNKFTPLSITVESGNLDQVKQLFEEHRDLSHIKKQNLLYLANYYKQNHVSDYLITQGTEHLCLSYKSLKRILKNQKMVQLDIGFKEEFDALIFLLKHNELSLSHLNLNVQNFESLNLIMTNLVTAISFNTNLETCVLQYDDRDFSHRVKPYIERNRFLNHYSPYQNCLRKWGLSFGQVLPNEPLIVHLVFNILKLPIENINFEQALSSYEWLIFLLAENDSNNSLYFSCMASVVENLLKLNDQMHITQHENYPSWVKQPSLWVWSEKDFRACYKALKKHYPDQLPKICPTVKTYGQCILAVRELVCQENIDLSFAFDCLGKQRIELLKLNFTPIYTQPQQMKEKGMTVLENLKKYQDFIEIKQLLNCLKSTCHKVYQHAYLGYPPALFELPLDQAIEFRISSADLAFYKIAVIVSCKAYWDESTSGKSRSGLVALNQIMELCSAEGNSMDYLQMIQKEALKRYHKKNTITLFGFSESSIPIDNEVDLFYQYLSELDIENPDLTKIDILFEKVLAYTEKSIEKTNDYVKILMN